MNTFSLAAFPHSRRLTLSRSQVCDKSIAHVQHVMDARVQRGSHRLSKIADELAKHAKCDDDRQRIFAREARYVLALHFGQLASRKATK